MSWPPAPLKISHSSVYMCKRLGGKTCTHTTTDPVSTGLTQGQEGIHTAGLGGERGACPDRQRQNQRERQQSLCESREEGPGRPEQLGNTVLQGSSSCLKVTGELLASNTKGLWLEPKLMAISLWLQRLISLRLQTLSSL